ncbi:MAG: glycerate kinase, partial [Desulfobacteraceae bacterium]|nr:glycerate kinase [Desulfobacteraceae bacterium]
TFGTGELIKAALDHGAQKILLAVGGSATVDGGVGAAMALGWEFLDTDNRQIAAGGAELLRIKSIIPPTKKITVPVEVLCDVDNPLCGPHGAAKVYGPQKGATPEMVDLLEDALSHLAEIIKKQLGLDIINIPGSGSAGGLAAGAIAFMNARLVSGIETVMTHSRLEEAVAQADWVITGEGRFDHQSLMGKVVSGIAQTAQKSDTKVAVIAGEVLLTPDQYQSFGITDAIACMNDDMTLDYAMQNSPELLAQAAKKFTHKHLRNE